MADSRVWKIGAVAVAGLLGLALALMWPRGQGGDSPEPVPPQFPQGFTGELPAELVALNNKGIGEMEKFNTGGFGEAVKTFGEIVDRWPQWQVGKFNLAVALLNSLEDPGRTETLLRGIVESDPENARAQYTLGLLLQDRGRLDEAVAHLEKVCLELVPGDAHTWVRLGDCLGDGTASNGMKPTECYEKALSLNPYLKTALYKMSLVYRRSGDHERADQLLEKFTQLKETNHFDDVVPDYIWSGPLAEALGTRIPDARPGQTEPPVYTRLESAFTLSGNDRWAGSDDYEKALPGGLLARVKQRFGSAVAAFDADSDGDLDLLMPAAIVADGKVQDALFRNDGEGRFEEIGAQSGIRSELPSLGAVAGDIDVDGLVDLYLTTAGPNRLLRNQGGGKFAPMLDDDRCAAADSVSLQPLFIDLDHDSDLDLVVANFGPTTESAKLFVSESEHPGAANSLFLNVSKARTGQQPENAPIFDVAFRAMENPGPWGKAEATVGFAVSDVDNDKDLDFVEITDDSCRVLVNLRLGRWSEYPIDIGEVSGLTGGLTCDFDNDKNIDLALVGPTRHSILLRNRGGVLADQEVKFEVARGDLEGLRSAQAVDIDMDGWSDLVGIGSGGPTLGLNRARGLMNRPVWITPLLDEKTASGLLVADFLNGSWPQVLVILDGESPALLQTEGNRNHWVRLDTVGIRENTFESGRKTLRSNPHAIGAKLLFHAGSQLTVWEQTTTTAGLGVSRLPIILGVAANAHVDTVRIRWPDGVEQAELNLPTRQVVSIRETQRRQSSCPILFSWNGERFEFVGDFLGGGGIGYLVAPGVYSHPDPDEDVRITHAQLRPDAQGQYTIKVAEPMDEITYLDWLELEVIDHPADWEVYPDERFNPETAHHSGGRIVSVQRFVPDRAVTEKGKDCLKQISQADRMTVDSFDKSQGWIGYAGDHYVEFEFDKTPVEDLGKLGLLLTGWVEYPYSQTNWAAATSGAELKPPTLEIRNADGAWEMLDSNMGYPAGLTRTMVYRFSDSLEQRLDRARPLALRIKTNMEIYWDQISLTTIGDWSKVDITRLEPKAAELGYRGYLQEYSPDGRLPLIHDYHQLNSEPLVGLRGERTPYGSVHGLLAAADERFALINAGDEATVVFDGSQLPAPRSGWKRNYILRSKGFCKDTDLYNPSGTLVGPLPKYDSQPSSN